MNAREEILKFIGTKEVEAVEISFKPNDIFKIILSFRSYERDFGVFVEQMDFNYNAGYGIQKLFGTIWFLDGTWATRYEYDGSEKWMLHERPPIPAPVR